MNLITAAQEASLLAMAVSDILDSLAAGQLNDSRPIEGATLLMLAALLQEKATVLHEVANTAAVAEQATLRAEITARGVAKVVE